METMSDTPEEEELAERQKFRDKMEKLYPGFFDWRELTEEEIARTLELAKKHGWEASAKEITPTRHA